MTTPVGHGSSNPKGGKLVLELAGPKRCSNGENTSNNNALMHNLQRKRVNTDTPPSSSLTTPCPKDCKATSDSKVRPFRKSFYSV